METSQHTFYTLGPDFTILVRDLIAEGAYHTAYEILSDGGLPKNYILEFFRGGVKFTGDSRDKEGLSVDSDEDNLMSPDKFSEFLMVGMRTMISREEDIEFIDLFSLSNDLLPDDKRVSDNIKALYKVIPRSMLRSQMLGIILSTEGYKIVDNIDTNFNGVILQNGNIVECGFQDHVNLYRVLYKLGYSTNSDWSNDSKVVHISSGQLCGTVSSQFQNYDMYHNYPEGNPTLDQLETLKSNYKNLSIYGRSKGIMRVFIDYYEDLADKGGKYGKLLFLKECYPNINLPIFSDKVIPDVKNCIRTSPKLSIPGLLNSKFNINENSIQEIKDDWVKVKQVVGYNKFNDGTHRETNKLNWFYQEFLEGANGVAHLRGGVLTASCSNDRGDIVKGSKGKYVLSKKEFRELTDILKPISEDLKKDIQVEFVIKKETIYVVQLRMLEDSNEYRPYTIDHTKVLYTGDSFSMQYSKELTVEDVLIIKDECESHELIGKKALIVTSDVEFSHALALSFSLKIPSIYNTGKIDLPEKFKIDTNGRDGYILKI